MFFADDILFCLHIYILLLVCTIDDMAKILDVLGCMPVNDTHIRRYWTYSWYSHESSGKQSIIFFK